MTTGRNFKDQGTPGVIDDTYAHCNFSQSAPIEVGEAKRGVRLFPGDDTPRTFIECNLTNAEPPPGSVLVNCLTVIKEFNALTGSETVNIDGFEVVLEHHGDIIYGRYGTTGYDYLNSPQVIEID